MTKDQFVEQMRSLCEIYPALKNRHKLGRIYYFFEKVPDEVVSKIIMEIGDDAKSAPSISDFKERVSRWRRDYYAKHGFNYGQEKEEITSCFECKSCSDSGIVEVFENDTKMFRYHMRCSCEFGQKHFAKLPEWSNELRGGFYTEPPKIENFKPDSLDNFVDSLTVKFYKWKNKLKESEDLWQSLGYE